MFFELLGTAIGLGASIYGASEQKKSVKKQNREIDKANAKQQEVAKQNKLASQASVNAERARLQQMELEGIRRRRDIQRQAQGARALGIARANSSGASLTDSSVQAGQQQLAATQRADTLANLQNIMIGRTIYKENAKAYAAQAKGAQFQTQANNYLSQAQQISNSSQYQQQIFGAGIQLAGNAQTFGRVAENTFSGVRDIFSNYTNPYTGTTGGLK